MFANPMPVWGGRFSEDPRVLRSLQSSETSRLGGKFLRFLQDRTMYVALALGIAVVAASAALAASGPTLNGYGPGIDPLPAYDGQSKCAPAAKPGVLAFQAMVLDRYPGTGTGGISRACNIGGKSEHKEGRAWDWGVNAGNKKQKAMADELIAQLTKTDRYGNANALSRRIGIMYLIWNRQIWFPGSGWRVYCVQKDFGCHTPGDRKSLRHPHTDHVHFSFTWDGARKRTTYWRKPRSMAKGIAASGSGYWVATGNGGVAPLGVGSYGSLASKPLGNPIVAIAASPSGAGYLLMTKHARVIPFGDARARASVAGKTKKAVSIASTPTGKGYWIAASGGRLFALGDAKHHGGLGKGKADAPVTGVAATSTGKGYWMVTRAGQVAAFGDAPQRPGFKNLKHVVPGIVSTPSGKGFWLFTTEGRVKTAGDAKNHGDLRDRSMKQPIVAMARTRTGAGYWLVNRMGKVFAFGDARSLGSVKTMARLDADQTDPSFPTDPADFPDH